MTHKLVGFADSANQTNVDYIKSQLSTIANKFSGLQTEAADETDSRLSRHLRRPDLLPCYMLFKNDAYKAHIQAKMFDEKAIEWVREKLG
tara:strand:- start:32091 stop:32360 length:270 start_codon:yes stop_codon:yes gene_type:complete